MNGRGYSPLSLKRGPLDQKVVVIGIGMAGTDHARALEDVPGITIVAGVESTRLHPCMPSIVQEELPIGYVQVIVNDNGTGISDDILPKIFDLNFSTKPASTKGRGLGLGLWWIRNFVRRANSDITVTSTLNEGSSFTVKIPFERPPDQVRLPNR